MISIREKLIKNWKNLGLAKKSYVRIEMSIKIENTVLPEEQLLDIYNDVYQIINVEALEKLSKK